MGSGGGRGSPTDDEEEEEEDDDDDREDLAWAADWGDFDVVKMRLFHEEGACAVAVKRRGRRVGGGNVTLIIHTHRVRLAAVPVQVRARPHRPPRLLLQVGARRGRLIDAWGCGMG